MKRQFQNISLTVLSWLRRHLRRLRGNLQHGRPSFHHELAAHDQPLPIRLGLPASGSRRAHRAGAPPRQTRISPPESPQQRLTSATLMAGASSSSRHCQPLPQELGQDAHSRGQRREDRSALQTPRLGPAPLLPFRNLAFPGPGRPTSAAATTEPTFGRASQDPIWHLPPPTAQAADRLPAFLQAQSGRASADPERVPKSRRARPWRRRWQGHRPRPQQLGSEGGEAGRKAGRERPRRTAERGSAARCSGPRRRRSQGRPGDGGGGGGGGGGTGGGGGGGATAAEAVMAAVEAVTAAVAVMA